MKNIALIVGASGVTGSALAERLLGNGWSVLGLSRGRTPLLDGVEPIRADLTSRDEVARALAGRAVTHVFFTAWARQANEKENIRVNGAMVSNVLDALHDARSLKHAALVTGLKHYLGPFEACMRPARFPRRRSGSSKDASRSIISIMNRKTVCSRRRSAAGIAGACIVRIR